MLAFVHKCRHFVPQGWGENKQERGERVSFPSLALKFCAAIVQQLYWDGTQVQMGWKSVDR